MALGLGDPDKEPFVYILPSQYVLVASERGHSLGSHFNEGNRGQPTVRRDQNGVLGDSRFRRTTAVNIVQQGRDQLHRRAMRDQAFGRDWKRKIGQRLLTLPIGDQLIEQLTGEENLAELHQVIMKDAGIVVDLEVLVENVVNPADRFAEPTSIPER